MRWSTVLDDEGDQRVGVWSRQGLHLAPIGSALLDLIAEDRLDDVAAEALERPAQEFAAVLPPIPQPPSIRDFMAFEDHVTAGFTAIGMELDPLWYSLPGFYFTNPAAVHGAAEPVAIPPGSAALDYELEVAAVIGREGRDLDPQQAFDHIAGFLIFCDWSARDLQGVEMKLNIGPAKGKDFAHSVGPWMVTPDEFPLDAVMTASVNGRRYSAGRLDSLYWSFGDMISYASRGTRVVPGDLIVSGTVGTGCILELSSVHGAEAFPWLAAGDRVELTVDGLGSIETVIEPSRCPHPPEPADGRRVAGHIPASARSRSTTAGEAL